MAAGLDSRLWRVAYETESSFGEDASSLSSAIELPVTGDRPNIGFELPQAEVNATRRYSHDGVRDIPTTWGGSFSFDMLLTGLGADPTGSISSNVPIALLARAIGNSDVTSEGTTVDTTWSDGNSGAIVGGSFADGSLAKIGENSPKDGRGNGVAHRVDNVTTGTLTLKTNAQTAPQSGDAVNAMGLVYPDEDPQGALTGLRFLLASKNQQYLAHGCFISGLDFSAWTPGQVPRVTVTVSVSRVSRVSGQFSGSAPTRLTGAPVANGLFWYNAKGTATYQATKPRDVSLSVSINVVPGPGPDGVDEHQSIVSAFRLGATAQLSFTVDAEDAGTDDWGDWYRGTTTEDYRHILFTLSATDKRAVALYMPKVKPVGTAPPQIDNNGRNAQRIQVEALTDTDGGSALERAAWLLGMG